MIDDLGKQPDAPEVDQKPRRTSKNSNAKGRGRGRRRSADRENVRRRDPDGQETNSDSNLPGDPEVLPRDEHIISRKNIDPDCLKVMRRLIRHGYKAFLVGGGVRDLLLERTPKDFDLSTDAKPEDVRALFRNSRIIGRRFRMNHVYFKGNKIIEVSTFRSMTEVQDLEEVQTLARDNTYGDPQTDAVRRDLTINGLFYDLESFSVIDYVGGIRDLRDEVIRIIGEPHVRFTEDPVRMIRAIRHAARTDFTIEPVTYEALCEMNESILLCPRARVYEEFQRELLGGYARSSFRLLDDSKLLRHLFPSLAQALETDRGKTWSIVEPRLKQLDERFAQGRPVSAAVAFASVLFDVLPEGDESEDDLISDYWTSELRHHDDDESEFQSIKPQFSVSRPKTRRKKTASPLMLFINDYFEPIGVPRKERERMEQLIVARYHMVLSKPEGSFARTLMRASYFTDALLLLELTSSGEQAKNAFELWKEASGGSKRGESKKKPRRRRSRSRGKRSTAKKS